MPVFSCGGMRYQQSWSQGVPFSDENQANLEATVHHAIDIGINHIETARGYGTSETQLGIALKKVPRNKFILQSKVTPKADPKEFERHLLESFERLQVDTLDLFGFHGLNTMAHVDWVLRPGGCYEVAERLRQAGKIKNFGFSTHGPCDVIRKAIDSDKFDYVNLHYYFIFQENRPAVDDAMAHDMGVFIISPSDKGGHLHTPSARIKALCAPWHPMLFNDIFCLSQPGVHTLSLGSCPAVRL